MDTFGMYVADEGPHSPVRGTIVFKQIERCAKALAELWNCAVNIKIEAWDHYDHANLGYRDRKNAHFIEFSISIYRSDLTERYVFGDLVELHEYVAKMISEQLELERHVEGMSR